jgi:predicted nucleic acid-binding protein
VIRVLLDANVLAPGFLDSVSASTYLIDLWQQGVYELVVSDHLLEETARTYTKPYFHRRVDPEQVERYLDFLRRYATVIEPTIFVSGVAT